MKMLLADTYSNYVLYRAGNISKFKVISYIVRYLPCDRSQFRIVASERGEFSTRTYDGRGRSGESSKCDGGASTTR
jgi:hypothetical protein